MRCQRAAGSRGGDLPPPGDAFLKTLSYSIFPHFYQHSGGDRHGELTRCWLIVRAAVQAAYVLFSIFPSGLLPAARSDALLFCMIPFDLATFSSFLLCAWHPNGLAKRSSPA